MNWNELREELRLIPVSSIADFMEDKGVEVDRSDFLSILLKAEEYGFISEGFVAIEYDIEDPDGTYYVHMDDLARLRLHPSLNYIYYEGPEGREDVVSGNVLGIKQFLDSTVDAFRSLLTSRLPSEDVL